jgi:WD domain, G-beta repeat
VKPPKRAPSVEDGSHREKERERERKRRRQIVRSLATGIVIAFLLTGFAGWHWWEAKRQGERALAGQLAAQSKTYMSSYPQRSLLLAAAGIQRARKAGLNVPSAQQALLDSLSATGGMPLHGHEGSVTSVSFSPDGKRLASGSDDKTVQIWDLNPAELEQLACRTAGRNFTCNEWQQFFGAENYRPVCPEIPYPKDCGQKK